MLAVLDKGESNAEPWVTQTQWLALLYVLPIFDGRHGQPGILGEQTVAVIQTQMVDASRQGELL